MATYRGCRVDSGREVRVMKDGKILSPLKSQELLNHSPCGFEWGYSGSGPAQLALALLLEELDPDAAVALHQDFKSEVVVRWHNDGWQITSEEIVETCRQIILASGRQLNRLLFNGRA